MKRQLSKLARAMVPGFVRRIAKARVTRRYYRPPPLGAGNGLSDETADTVTATFNGVRLVVPAAARADAIAIIDDRFTAQELAVICSAAGKGGRLLDIGGHRGLVSGFYCASDPNARAWCFEPSPPLAAACRALAGLNGAQERLQVRGVALGATAGRQTMLFDPVGGYVQVKRYDHTMWAEPQSIEFEVDTVDAFCRREQIAPTLIKIDVEGFEYEVLQGATDVLRRVRPEFLVELHLNFLDDRGVEAAEVLRPLIAANYAFTLLDGREITAREICDCPLNRLHFLARPAATAVTTEMS